ncbi:MAG: P-loop NTPase [Thermodesulfobacteriota bacterium]
MPEQKKIPVIWAVGGGKGGVGKSIISSLIGFWLSRMGKETVLVDTDLGGANLHTLMGIKTPPKTLNDFLSKKTASLNEVCINSEVNRLKLITGAGEILSLANPKFAQKIKIMKGILKLDADHVILDLGAGSSYNTLDFFLMAEKKIAVVTPQPTSIQNAYAFIRSAVYRRLSQLTSRDPSISALIQTAMNPKNDLQMRTIKELCQVIEDLEGPDAAKEIKKDLSKIHPVIITNMVKDPADKNAGKIVQLVAEKYLTIQSENFGTVVYDRQIEQMVSEMTPLVRISQSSELFGCVYNIVTRML